MGRLLTGSIDLTKIDKSKLVTKDKFGQPFKNGGKYLDISIWVEDPNQVNQYGNIGSISYGKSKEERVYIGNLKEFNQVAPATAETIAVPGVPVDSGDGLPF